MSDAVRWRDADGNILAVGDRCDGTDIGSGPWEAEITALTADAAYCRWRFLPSRRYPDGSDWHGPTQLFNPSTVRRGAPSLTQQLTEILWPSPTT